MAVAEIEMDTAEQVIEAGRALIALCQQIPDAQRPEGLGRATITLRVLLDELEEQAGERGA